MFHFSFLPSRGLRGKESRSLYAFPPEVAEEEELPSGMADKLTEAGADGRRGIKVAVW